MTKIVILGAKGRMGQALIRCAAAIPAVQVVAAIDQGEKRIVATLADALPGLENRAQLPHEDVSGPDLLAAKPLHAATLGIGIPTVAAGSLTFLMCHINT